jgi:hypothetical protein
MRDPFDAQTPVAYLKRLVRFILQDLVELPSIPIKSCMHSVRTENKPHNEFEGGPKHATSNEYTLLCEQPSYAHVHDSSFSFGLELIQKRWETRYKIAVTTHNHSGSSTQACLAQRVSWQYIADV